MKKSLKNKNFSLLLIGAVIYVTYILLSQQVEIYKYNKEINANNQKIVQQEQKTIELSNSKNTYKSDEFIEKLAREKLGYVKPGEKVFIDRAER